MQTRIFELAYILVELYSVNATWRKQLRKDKTWILLLTGGGILPPCCRIPQGQGTKHWYQNTRSDYYGRLSSYRTNRKRPWRCVRSVWRGSRTGNGPDVMQNVICNNIGGSHHTESDRKQRHLSATDGQNTVLCMFPPRMHKADYGTLEKRWF